MSKSLENGIITRPLKTGATSKCFNAKLKSCLKQKRNNFGKKQRRMNEISLYTKLNNLPTDLKAEVNDFIDFLLAKKKGKSNRPRRVFGIAKGKISMSADFDKPLQDFSEYME